MSATFNEPIKQVILRIPAGVELHDIEGLLRGFSRATGKPQVDMNRMPGAYETFMSTGDMRMLIIPARSITEITAATVLNDLKAAEFVLKIQADPEAFGKLTRAAFR